MHPLNLLHPRAMLTLPWHCSCVTLQHQFNTSPLLSVGKKRNYQVHFPWWNFRTDWTNWAALPSVQVLDIGLFLICTGWKVHMIPSFSCPVPATSSEAEITKAASSSKLMFQSTDCPEKSHHSVLPTTQHTHGHKNLNTVLQTEGLLCSMTWTNHFCQYSIQGWRLLFILKFSCKWFTVAICWKHTPSFLWKSSRGFWHSEKNLMSCLINAGKSLNL